MKKYDEMINELVEIEMDEGCHDDFPEDYDNKLEYYLSNAEQDSYINYLLDNNKADNEEEAEKLQDAVIAEINRRYEAIQLAASMAGRKGGKSKSAAKAAASRENGKLGGRPRKTDK